MEAVVGGVIQQMAPALRPGQERCRRNQFAEQAGGEFADRQELGLADGSLPLCLPACIEEFHPHQIRCKIRSQADPGQFSHVAFAGEGAMV